MSYQEHEELKALGFPPRISIGVTPLTTNPQPLKLQVEGLNEDCTFDLSLGIVANFKIIYVLIHNAILFLQIISSLKLTQLQYLYVSELIRSMYIMLA